MDRIYRHRASCLEFIDKIPSGLEINLLKRQNHYAATDEC